MMNDQCRQFASGRHLQHFFTPSFTSEDLVNLQLEWESRKFQEKKCSQTPARISCIGHCQRQAQWLNRHIFVCTSFHFCCSSNLLKTKEGSFRNHLPVFSFCTGIIFQEKNEPKNKCVCSLIKKKKKKAPKGDEQTNTSPETCRD